MGGRNTYAAGKNVPPTYKTVGFFHGVKVLAGIGGKHDLPEEAHSSEAYAKLFKDGNLQKLRFYGEDKRLEIEIGYHPVPSLTGHNRHTYHIHFYSPSFARSKERLLTAAEIARYAKFFTMKDRFR